MTVNRITGLDPAGPGFNYPEKWYDEFDNLTDTHLWYTDADFVDVIHTGIYFIYCIKFYVENFLPFSLSGAYDPSKINI